jgi:hypothetical protein
MHTVIGRNPERSPDLQYKLGIEAHGASAKAYTARTKKKVFVWLGSNSTNNLTVPLKRTYTFVSASLDWNVDWHTSEEVAVHFFDYGEGVSEYSKGPKTTNQIASMLFRKSGGTFVEVK